MKVTSFYDSYPNYLLIHGITNISVESRVENKTLQEKIKHSIDNSFQNKLSTFSWGLSQSTITQRWGTIGLLIQDGDIFCASEEDTGLIEEDIQKMEQQTVFDWQKILKPPPDGHNEIILKNIIPYGLIIMVASEYELSEVTAAAEHFNFPLTYMDIQGAIRKIDTSLTPISNEITTVRHLF